MNNALQTISPSSETGLATTLNGLEEAVYAAANRNLDAALASSPADTGLTQLERTAIVEVEALKLTNGIDLTALLLRGRILAKIRNQNLLNVHPEHYVSLADMANANALGISSTELSNTDALCNIIFPYLENNGFSVTEVWHDIGKSKFFELVPILSAVITGEMPGRGETREAVLNILQGHGGEVSDDGNVEVTEAVRNNAVADLIEMGSLPVREMRRQLRPRGTADIPAVILQQGDMYYAAMQMTEDQLVMFRRLTHEHLNETIIPENPEIEPQVTSIRRMIGA
jgi:hypothetical protein